MKTAASATDRDHARSELRRRFLDQEVFGYEIENVSAATSVEAVSVSLPERSVMLLARGVKATPLPAPDSVKPGRD
jgi:hypothetical protein